MSLAYLLVTNMEPLQPPNVDITTAMGINQTKLGIAR